MAVLYPNGYSTSKMTLEQLAARHGPGMHPEFARRHFALIEASEGLLGIGSSVRSTETQAANYAKYPGRFAPPGYSFHEKHLWKPSGIVAFAAVDTVGIDGRHREAWEFVRKNGLRYGIKSFHNVNNEPWHDQFSELPNSVRQWKAQGSPDPTRWNLPDHTDLDFEYDDGIDPDADPETQPQTDPDKLNQTEEMVRQLPTLRRGDKGEDVQTVQALLNARIDGRNLDEDGHFGPATEQAVEDFQAWVGISSDGIVGRNETWPELLLVAT